MKSMRRWIKRQDLAMLKLRESEPVAQGHKRFVFQHPTDSNLLIKVLQPEVVEARWGRGRPWYKGGRYRQYVSLQREFSEHLALAARFPNGVPVLQKLLGIVETDYGIGAVVEKLTGRDGGLAPSLAELVRRDGVTSQILERVEHFRNELLHYGVVVGKLHDRNLVLAVRDGEERFVMIDGYGEKAAIPINVWSPRLNAAHTRRRVDVLMEKLRAKFALQLETTPNDAS
jgi:hypothetical protein